MTKLVIYRSRSVRRSQRFRWRLVANNGRVVAVSGEGYANENEALFYGKKVAYGGYSDFRVVDDVLTRRS